MFNPSSTTVPPATPQTTPTVDIIVNGVINDISFISTGQQSVNAGQQYLFPIVATTGRTAVQATAINHVHVAGSATNFTASRGSVPFQSGLSGLDHLRTASFGGNADAVGLDVNGPIGKLQVLARDWATRRERARRLPSSAFPPTGSATRQPASSAAWSPRRRSARSVWALPTPSCRPRRTPDFVQTSTTGSATYYPAAGQRR